MALGVYIDGVVGTGGYAGLAPYAYVPVEVYDPVGTLVHGGGGTCVNTGGLVTLVAAGDLKVVSGIGEGPDHNLLYISTRNPQGHAVFLFAGDGAGVTPDTPVLVYYLAPLYPLCAGVHRSVLYYKPPLPGPGNRPVFLMYNGTLRWQYFVCAPGSLIWGMPINWFPAWA